MVHLKDSDLKAVSDKLAQISRPQQKLELQATNFFRVMGYFDVEYKKTDKLADLQRQVLQGINPFRDGMRQRGIDNMNNSTGELHTNMSQYGYSSVGGLFRPHITLTRFYEEQPTAEEHIKPLAEFTSVADKLAMFEMGDNGTCVKKVVEYKLV